QRADDDEAPGIAQRQRPRVVGHQDDRFLSQLGGQGTVLRRIEVDIRSGRGRADEIGREPPRYPIDLSVAYAGVIEKPQLTLLLQDPGEGAVEERLGYLASADRGRQRL